ncbi:MAG: hypothetical protein MUD14_08590 [Hydrococcus sp. Prado102]|jgi:type I restriction enzyme M protein|nr:hypothetical protein [Hydrococcus sp. Prado102]
MDYLDFIATITERGHIKTFIEADSGVKEQEGKLGGVFDDWWELHAPNLARLPQTKAVMTLRGEFLSSFVENLAPVGLLDRFKVAGVVASWWDEVRYELRTLSESGFGGLVDSWVDTIKDALEDEEDKKSQTKFDPLNHKLVVRLLSDYLTEIAEAEAKIAELEQEKEAFERSDESEEEEEESEEGANVAKDLENQLKTLKNSIKEEQKQLKELKKKGSLFGAEEIAKLEAKLVPIEAEIKEIEAQLQPYKEIKTRLNAAKKELRQLKTQLVARFGEARQGLSEDACQKLVLGIFREGIRTELERYVTAHRQQVISAVENWWDKYRVTLLEIEKERDEAAKRLDEFLKVLGYAND